jgi:hypothetical protein
MFCQTLVLHIDMSENIPQLPSGVIIRNRIRHKPAFPADSVDVQYQYYLYIYIKNACIYYLRSNIVSV